MSPLPILGDIANVSLDQKLELRLQPLTVNSKLEYCYVPITYSCVPNCRIEPNRRRVLEILVKL